MAERVPVIHEQGKQQEAFIRTPEHKALPTAEQAEALRPGEVDPQTQLEHARDVAERTASTINPLDRLKESEEAAQPKQSLHITKELKRISRQRELLHLQRKETLPQRTLSKVIHQSAVRVVSEVAGKSVSRPSGLLGGGLVALIGTTSYLLLAKHLGFEYNYFVFLLLFAAGFALGLILELIVWVATSSRRHAND